MMKKFAFAAALGLAACGQSTAPEPEAPAAPLSLLEQVQAQSAENQPVFAWQQLTAYQQAHPEATPACTSIRGAESRGIVPDNVAPGSVYEPFKGALVFSVQCGPQLTTAHDEPREHWLVAFAPGAAEAAVVNCADAAGRNDRCGRAVPTAEAATP